MKAFVFLSLGNLGHENTAQLERFFISRQVDSIGRGDRIRTCDICVPNAALYQAELLPADCEVGGKLSDLGILGKTEFVYSSAISMRSDFTTAGESSG